MCKKTLFLHHFCEICMKVREVSSDFNKYLQKELRYCNEFFTAYCQWMCGLYVFWIFKKYFIETELWWNENMCMPSDLRSECRTLSSVGSEIRTSDSARISGLSEIRTFRSTKPKCSLIQSTLGFTKVHPKKYCSSFNRKCCWNYWNSCRLVPTALFVVFIELV